MRLIGSIYRLDGRSVLLLPLLLNPGEFVRMKLEEDVGEMSVRTAYSKIPHDRRIQNQQASPSRDHAPNLTLSFSPTPTLTLTVRIFDIPGGPLNTHSSSYAVHRTPAHMPLSAMFDSGDPQERNDRLEQCFRGTESIALINTEWTSHLA